MGAKILTNFVLIPMGVPICLENLLAMVVLFQCRRMIPQIKILAMNLSLTDFCTGLTLCLPDTIFGSCTFKKYLAGPFVVVSLLTITLIFVDRCCSLLFSLRYFRIVTHRRIIAACISVWIFSITLVYFMFHDNESKYGIYCGILYLTPKNTLNIVSRVFVLMILVMNISMYFYLSYTASLRFTKKVGTSSKDANGIVRKLSVITGFFLVCYSPYVVTQVLQDTVYTSAYTGIIHALTLSLTLLNSAINPFLYVWRFAEVRFQLKFLLWCWNSKKMEKIRHERNSFFATYSISYM